MKLPKDIVDLGNVWGTYSTASGLLFQSRNYLLAWDGMEFEVVKSVSGYHNSFQVGDAVYIREFGVGLLVYENGVLEFVSGSDELADEMIFGVTVSSNRSLVWSQSSGIFEVSDATVVGRQAYSDELQEIAANVRLYTAAQWSDENVVIGTLGAGAIVVNDEGTVLDQLSIRNGFPDDFINDIHVESASVVWFAFNSEGVGSLTFKPAKLRYAKSHGLWGHVNRVGLIDDRLAVATGSRLMTAVSSGGQNLVYSTNPNTSYFEEIPGTELAWDFLTVDGYTIVGTENEGVLIDNTGRVVQCVTATRRIERGTGSLRTQIFVLHYDHKRQVIYAGTNDGLYNVAIESIGDVASCTLYPLKVNGLDGLEIKYLVSTDDYLWVSTDNRGIFRIRDVLGRRSVRHMELSELDIEGAGSYVHLVDAGLPVIATTSGVYEMTNEAKANLTLVGSTTTVEGGLEAIGVDDTGQLVIAYRDSISVLSGISGSERRLVTPRGLVGKKGVTTSVTAANGVIYYNEGDELVRYDIDADIEKKELPTVYFSSVFVRDTEKSLTTGVYRSLSGGVTDEQPYWYEPTVSYENREIGARVTAESSVSIGPMVYQYSIEAPDIVWSEWSESAGYSISTLKEGRYTLLARAKNDLGQISEPAAFTFVILPPWYRTAWAYLAYMLFGVALVVSGRKYVSMRREHRLAAEQAKELERERTVNKALQEANTSLQKANKLKDEFLATTSHELRTPLTAILGFTSVLKEEVPKDAEYREFLDIIEDSGGRLMDTLSSLLDLAQLRSGNYEMSTETLEARDVVEEAVATMRDVAERKGLKFVVEEPAERIRVAADKYMFARVVYNLVNNAVKFTEEGEVRIRMGVEGECARIDIMDTGVGIEQKFLPELFEEYMQESDGNARSHEGSGLGLAISSQMMGLMNGTISVDSAKNMGSTFSIWFPLAEQAAQRADRPAAQRARSTEQQASESYRAD
ncbi:MAG: ATP-binding protein [Rhodothermales bacterium]